MNTSCDVLVVGGGIGGVAAALAAAESGARVVLTEESPWLGGQLTSQGVPPDENPWIETVGGTETYQRFRTLVRAHYRRDPQMVTDDPMLNPGQALVSRISHEPSVAVAVIDEMLAPLVAAGKLEIRRSLAPVSATVSGDIVRAVTFSDGSTVEATMVLDATEEGDLLPLVDAEHVIGSESITQTGEPHALPGAADPGDQQAITWCMAVEHRPGEDHTIDRPSDYGFWRDYQPDFWPDRMLSLTWSHPPTSEPRSAPLFGEAPEWTLWTYRRIRYGGHYSVPTTDVSVINWPQNDYLLGPIIGVSDADRQRHLAGARAQTVSLLYWLQTEAPRPDGGTGYPGLRPYGPAYGTDDGLALRHYVRESRRIHAITTVVEQHLSLEARKEFGRAMEYPDSVGIGSYRVDLHPSTGGRNYVDFASMPFEIPLGALIPVRLTNFLAAAKNIGTTHITNGCYRLHPVEWNIGESAGAAAAYCVRGGISPHALHADSTKLSDYQAMLDKRGVRRRWTV